MNICMAWTRYAQDPNDSSQVFKENLNDPSCKNSHDHEMAEPYEKHKTVKDRLLDWNGLLTERGQTPRSTQFWLSHKPVDINRKLYITLTYKNSSPNAYAYSENQSPELDHIPCWTGQAFHLSNRRF